MRITSKAVFLKYNDEDIKNAEITDQRYIPDGFISEVCFKLHEDVYFAKVFIETNNLGVIECTRVYFDEINYYDLNVKYEKFLPIISGNFGAIFEV